MNRYYKFFFSVLVLTVVSSILFSAYPYLTEGLYFKCVYRLVRMLFGNLSAIIPFPVIYLVIPLLLGLFVVGLRRRIQLKKKWYFLASFIISQVIWLVILFQWLWGFNYKRPLPFEAVSQLQKPDTTFLFQEAEWLVEELASLASHIKENEWPEVDLKKIDQAVQQTLEGFNLDTYGHASCKPLYPRGMLYRLQTSGFFMPLSAESYIDGAMLPFQQPYTIAHELCHAHGIGDEGLCNYIGWIACTESSSPYLRYSAYFGYMLYLFSDIGHQSPKRFENLKSHLDDYTLSNLEKRRELAQKYPDIFPSLRDWIYGRYLKTQGVTSGLRSYGELVTRIYNRKLSTNVHDDALVRPSVVEEIVFVLDLQSS